MARENALNVTLNTSEWNRFANDVKKFDPALMRSLRKRIRDVGSDAVAKVRATLAEPAPSGGDYSAGGRAALIAATRVSMSFSARSAGVKIMTASGGRGSWNLAYNSANFRHPVFGSDTWAEQQGNPYFGKVIGPLADREMLVAIRAALDEATAAIGGVVL